jgi:hypothetical protein
MLFCESTRCRRVWSLNSAIVYGASQVTDDLFDEIAQEVMDEDEQQALEGLAGTSLTFL